MKGQLRGLMVMSYGEYEFEDRDETTPFVVLYDVEGGSEAGGRMTMDASIDGDRPPVGSLVDVDVVGEIRQIVRRGQRKDGGSWEMPQAQFKFRATALSPAR